MKGTKLRGGKGVGSSQRRGSAVFQVDLQIMFTMWSQRVSLALAEDVSKVVVVWGNSGQICWFWNGGSRAEITLLRAELHAVLHRAFEATGQCESWCTDKGNVRSFAVGETWWIGCGRFSGRWRSRGLRRSVRVCWHGLF